MGAINKTSETVDGLEMTSSQNPSEARSSALNGLCTTSILIPSIDNPKGYGRREKWIITTIVTVAAAAAPMGAAMFYRKARQKWPQQNVSKPHRFCLKKCSD